MQIVYATPPLPASSKESSTRAKYRFQAETWDFGRHVWWGFFHDWELCLEFGVRQQHLLALNVFYGTHAFC